MVASKRIVMLSAVIHAISSLAGLRVVAALHAKSAAKICNANMISRIPLSIGIVPILCSLFLATVDVCVCILYPKYLH